MSTPARTPWSQCPAVASLTARELASLAAVPGGVHLLRRDLRCDAEARHRADHQAMAQAFSGRFGPFEHWLTWGPGTREIVVYLQAQMCTGEMAVPAAPWDTQACSLPGGHELGCHFPGINDAEVPDGAA